LKKLVTVAISKRSDVKGGYKEGTRTIAGDSGIGQKTCLLEKARCMKKTCLSRLSLGGKRKARAEERKRKRIKRRVKTPHLILKRGRGLYFPCQNIKHKMHAKEGTDEGFFVG